MARMFWRIVKSLTGCLLVCATAGCAIPLSREIAVPSRPDRPNVDPKTLFPEKVNVGYSRERVHQNLNGLKYTEFAKTASGELSEGYGGLEVYQITLFLGAYHGPHFFGIYPEYFYYHLVITYDETERVSKWRLDGPLIDLHPPE